MVSDCENLVVKPYNWVYKEAKKDERSKIHCWALDRDEKQKLLIFDYAFTFFVELPYFIDKKFISWDDDKLSHVKAFFDSSLRKDKKCPVDSYEYIPSKKIYFHRGGRKYPMLKVRCRNKSLLYTFIELAKNPINVPGLGAFTIELNEHKLPHVNKMLHEKKCKFSQWLEVKGVKPEYPVSESDEYVCDWEDINPINTPESAAWIANPTIFSWDIETYSDNHKAMPKKTYAKHVCTMISIVTQKLGNRASRKKFVITLMDSEPIKGAALIKVEDEVQLCDEFTRLLKEIDPEIVIGYNVFGYDYPYLIARLALYHEEWKSCGRIKVDKLDIEDKRWESKAYGPQVNNWFKMDGRINIDLMQVVQRDYKLPKYTLDFVSNHFLKKGKHDVSAKQMFETYEGKADCIPAHKVIEYCVQDSELVMDLFEKLNVWISIVAMSNIVCVTPEEVNTRGQQLRCISQVYREAKDKDFVINQRVLDDVLKFVGGYVGDPIVGSHPHVICLDFQSLYPSIMQAHNICFSTLLPPGAKAEPDTYHEISWNDADFVEEKDDEDEDQEPGEESELKPLASCNRTYRYTKEVEGVLPAIVRKLVAERRAVRNKMKEYEEGSFMHTVLDKTQLALKVSANSMYGFLGAKNGVLPLLEAAMSVTAKGRELILRCNEYIEKTYNGTIVYNDTDSTIFTIPGVNTNEACAKWGIKLEKEISALFTDPLYTEFEKCGTILAIKKKYYAFWCINLKDPEFGFKYKNGLPDIMYKGIPLSRRDSCKWKNTIYETLLRHIMKSGSCTDALNIIHDGIVALMEGKVDKEHLTMIRGLGANYKGNYFMKIFAEELAKSGNPHKAGDRIDYVIVINEEQDKLGYKMRIPELLTMRDEIDVGYYVVKLLMKSINTLFFTGYKREIELHAAKLLEDSAKCMRDGLLRIQQTANKRGYQVKDEDISGTYEHMAKVIKGSSTNAMKELNSKRLEIERNTEGLCASPVKFFANLYSLKPNKPI